MNDNVVRHDSHCRLCGSAEITTVLRLNPTPLEDQFVTEDRTVIMQPRYPLELAICGGCGYLHLPHVVDPAASYADYVYVSGVTVGLRGHYDDYAKQVVQQFGIPADSLAVDLGSNDGSMLASFKRQGLRVVGVEPAGNIAKQANEAGLTTINDFFTQKTAVEIREQHGGARVISANYMYANIDDVNAFTEAVATLLAPDGVFVVQTGYHPEQMKINMFDYVYHEHFSYFTVEVIQTLFARCGMQLIHAEKMTPKGGSIRLVGQVATGTRLPHESVQRLIEEERREGMRLPETYRKFEREIDVRKNDVLDLLRRLKTAGKSIVGFGASHSTTTLIYHFEIGSFIDYLVDDNQLKHGRYSPGLHLPVSSSARLYKDRPDYVIILGWQHQGSIMERHEGYVAAGGHWIVPLPALRVLPPGIAGDSIP